MNFLKLLPITILVTVLSVGSYQLLKYINNTYLSEPSSYQYNSISNDPSQKAMTISEDSPRYKKDKQVNVLNTVKHKVQKEAEKSIDKDRLIVINRQIDKQTESRNDAETSNPLFGLLYDKQDVDKVLDNREDIISLIEEVKKQVNSSEETKQLLRKIMEDKGCNGCNASFVEFDGKNLEGFTFSNAVMLASSFEGANLSGASISYSDLTASSFNEATIDNLNLSENLLSYANMKRVNGSQISITESSMTYFNLASSSFSDAKFANLDMYGLQGQNSIFKNSDFSSTSATYSNLTGSSFLDSNLEKMDLSYSELDSSSFRGSVLDSAILYQVSANYADFSSSSLENASILKSNLDSSSFRLANMSDSTFSANTCRSCSFEDASLLNVDIRDTNFTESGFSEGGYFTWDYAPPHPICGVTDINGRMQNGCGYEYERSMAH